MVLVTKTMVNVAAYPEPVIVADAAAVPHSMDAAVPVIIATVGVLLTTQLVQATPL